MSNFIYDREVVEYHTKIAELDISYYGSLMRELSYYSPDYITALADAEARLKFWSNVTIKSDEVQLTNESNN